MKVNEYIKIVLHSLFALACVALIAVASISFYRHARSAGSFNDLKLRYHEVCCSHTGVNPFHIWNQTIMSDKYKGIPHPDYKYDESPNKFEVHAYPAWHTTFFWFYGFISENVCVVLMSTFQIFVFIGGFIYFRRFFSSTSSVFFCLGVLLFLFIYPFLISLHQGNYGGLLLLLSIMFYESLKRKHEIVAGIIWGVMMIKPQVALLLFLPLLFSRKYLTISVAVIICICATLIQSFVYKESPIDLILQIPEIGRPYVGNNAGVISLALNKCFGVNGVFVGMCVGFLICAILSYRLRNQSSWFIRLFPAFALFPLWTYSYAYDLPAQWMVFVVMSAWLIQNLRNKWFMCKVVFLWILIFSSLYFLFLKFVMQDTSGIGWRFYLAQVSFEIVLLLNYKSVKDCVSAIVNSENFKLAQ